MKWSCYTKYCRLFEVVIPCFSMLFIFVFAVIIYCNGIHRLRAAVPKLNLLYNLYTTFKLAQDLPLYFIGLPPSLAPKHWMERRKKKLFKREFIHVTKTNNSVWSDEHHLYFKRIHFYYTSFKTHLQNLKMFTWNPLWESVRVLLLLLFFFSFFLFPKPERLVRLNIFVVCGNKVPLGMVCVWIEGLHKIFYSESTQKEIAFECWRVRDLAAVYEIK